MAPAAAQDRAETKTEPAAHTHGLVPDAVKRSREGLRAVGASLAILASALTAIGLAVDRFVHPLAPTHLLALGLAGATGVVGNAIAARVRTTAGRRLDSPALVADGQHARSDALVSASVIVTSIVVAAGATVADPIIGLLIAALILRITWESWQTVRRGPGHDRHDYSATSARAGDDGALP